MTNPGTGEDRGAGPTATTDPDDLPRLPRRPDRVVVLGAGITGLAAAHRLHALAPDVELVVVEAADRVGGKVLTQDLGGEPVDCAADAFLARVPEAVALCRELGLDDQLVTPAARSAFVLSGGELRRLPDGLVLGVPTDLDALAASGIVSEAGVARAAEDLDRPADGPPAGTDESVGDLVRRRLGDEVHEALVAPLLGGVNAGDADHLSLAAGAPQLAAAAGRGSLIEGLRAQRAAATADPDAPVFYGLRSGTSTLLEALAARLPAGALRLGTVATAIDPAPGRGFRVHLATPGDPGDPATAATPVGRVDADAVVVALPSWAAAPLVAGLPDLAAVADGLDALEWASVVMAALVVPADAVDHSLDGSGYLIPAAERRVLTACSFASSKWAHLARPGQVVLRASAGHAGDGGAAVAMDPTTLIDELLVDLGEHLGLDGAPDVVRATPWPRSLPQYRPGHLDRARTWQTTAWGTHPGLWLTGASFEGLGLPACVRQGEAAARRVLGVDPAGDR